MTTEAIRPHVKGETPFVDDLISFAVDTANLCLVPQRIPEKHWKELSGAERFYLKLLDLEAKGLKTLDNYQNFAKAFKVRDFRTIVRGSQKANHARLKSAAEFGRLEMSEGSELYQTVFRAVLYALMELLKDVDGGKRSTISPSMCPTTMATQHCGSASSKWPVTWFGDLSPSALKKQVRQEFFANWLGTNGLAETAAHVLVGLPFDELPKGTHC